MHTKNQCQQLLASKIIPILHAHPIRIPNVAKNPQATQTIKLMATESVLFSSSFGVMKIPDPIIVLEVENSNHISQYYFSPVILPNHCLEN